MTIDAILQRPEPVCICGSSDNPFCPVCHPAKSNAGYTLTIDDIRRLAAEASDAEEFGVDSINMLLAEIDRLRGLIKETFNDRSRADCQWCDGGPERINGRTAHAKDCPAFTPEGVVR